MTTVHSNGLHHTVVALCHCPDQPSTLEQLLRAGFFPATTEHPQTIFTLAVIKDFRMQTHEAGTTAHAYHSALQCQTDPIFKDRVEDRYQEFLRVIQVWGHIEDQLRTGLPFGINQYLPQFHRDCLAVICPAYLQPGINMSPNISCELIQKRPHLFTCFLAADGNFHLVAKDKNQDEEARSLASGCAYMVADEPYWTYLEHVHDDIECETCTNHKAGQLGRQLNSKHLRSRGKAVINCTRHTIVRPKAMVDFPKGER
ncbi:hypothetical protein M422DRAFT_190614 [Sphaerobolus stellatus SS14]|uniref:CxC2-like cysteine cluster KDZ transposase-associated domain-containing protein n=1 Tax=Sphaerobolus stellatus (strain SS14) TaxID=990650 RepID=A0A0C9UR37_SPHS4|nr:hypothetical protein M422DRAFT_190614 [Sphaerobolus stellatus SS14]